MMAFVYKMTLIAEQSHIGISYLHVDGRWWPSLMVEVLTKEDGYCKTFSIKGKPPLIPPVWIIKEIRSTYKISPYQVSWKKLSSTNYILHVSSAVARTARRARWRRFENFPINILSFVSVMSWMRSSTKYSESERLLLATTAIGGLELATTQRSRKIHRCSHLHDYYHCHEPSVNHEDQTLLSFFQVVNFMAVVECISPCAKIP